MQQPTLRNVRIRSTRDAIAVFYGVARNSLPLITRRLDAEERLAITAGTVFVWEENANSEASGLGMERWQVEGCKADLSADPLAGRMAWGGDRVAFAMCVEPLVQTPTGKRLPMAQEFLFYHQKEDDVGEETVNPVTPWAQMMRKRSNRFAGNPSATRKASETQRLIKQTFSVLVSLPKDRPAGIVRKWHLTAYFNQETLNELDTIDDLRLLETPVPEGWFRSARATKNRRDNRTLSDPAAPGVALSSPTSDQPLSMPFNAAPAAQRRYRGQGATPRSVGENPSPLVIPVPLNAAARPPVFLENPMERTARLVPLEYLQNASVQNRRNPTDEQLLRRLG
uniref:Uncharacterized protein n=1 Tax=Mycena chlorophos TaxID=658473 RepID=A0ABQ0KV09_MYCCL|nr:predicted protein [Mycena chlorophos]